MSPLRSLKLGDRFSLPDGSEWVVTAFIKGDVFVRRLVNGEPVYTDGPHVLKGDRTDWRKL